MRDKHSGSDFPRENNQRENNYYRPDRYMHQNRHDNDDSQAYHDNQNYDFQNPYENHNTGKYENYNGGGYYGSNYGSTNELNRGRDYEQNAGYRDNYNRLTTGQWPEIEDAARRRGMDLREIELQRRGVYRGKGPANYRRSDFRIHEDVYDVLLEDPYVDASDIEISVEKGEVILTGTVESRLVKRRVEDLVERLPGISHFENRLKVRNGGNQTVNINSR